jgi:hypothetical protein
MRTANKINASVSHKFAVFLSAEEANKMADDLLRAITEANNHGTCFPITLLGSDVAIEFYVEGRLPSWGVKNEKNTI